MENYQQTEISTTEDQDGSKLFVGGIDSSVSQEELLQYFQKFGLISQVKIVGEAQGKSRGFGFVHFISPRVLQRVTTLKHVIKGKEVDCMKAKSELSVLDLVKEEERALRNIKIFIKYVPLRVKKNQLFDYFSRFGEIEEIHLVQRRKKKSGFCYIKFKFLENLTNILGIKCRLKNGVELTCALAHPKRAKTSQPLSPGSSHAEVQGDYLKDNDPSLDSLRGLASNDTENVHTERNKSKGNQSLLHSQFLPSNIPKKEYPYFTIPNAIELDPGHYPAPPHLITQFPRGIPPSLIYNPNFVYGILFSLETKEKYSNHNKIGQFDTLHYKQQSGLNNKSRIQVPPPKPFQARSQFPDPNNFREDQITTSKKMGPRKLKPSVINSSTPPYFNNRGEEDFYSITNNQLKAKGDTRIKDNQAGFKPELHQLNSSRTFSKNKVHITHSENTGNFSNQHKFHSINQNNQENLKEGTYTSSSYLEKHFTPSPSDNRLCDFRQPNDWEAYKDQNIQIPNQVHKNNRSSRRNQSPDSRPQLFAHKSQKSKLFFSKQFLSSDNSMSYLNFYRDHREKMEQNLFYRHEDEVNLHRSFK